MLLPKLLLSAVVSILLLTLSTATITKAATTTQSEILKAAVSELLRSAASAARAAETTTSLLPLQPPINVTSTTTSSFLQKQHQQDQIKKTTTNNNSSIKIAIAADGAAKSGSLLLNDDNRTNEKQHNDNVTRTLEISDFQPLVSSVPEKQSVKTGPNQASNSNGYIQFELNYPEQEEQQKTKTTKKVETVNEVLSNLFPNGFSDIFRFSYASEDSPSTTTTTTMRAAPNLTTSTTAEPAFLPTSTSTPAENKTFYSLEASVSKEYRREVSPGHTEIVVEKLSLAPRSSSGEEEFRDGSNFITKDELLRINRAAVGASVLPSLLVEPSKENSSSETKDLQTAASRSSPIIILNDDTEDLEDPNEEDNLIAESQNVGQQFYQRLPESVNSYPYKDEGNYKPEHQEQQQQQINVQIIHDDTLKQSQEGGSEYAQQLFSVTHEQEAGKQETTSAHSVSQHELDNFQEHAEKNFKQRNLVQQQEAASRKFLKNFNPVLSESNVNVPVSKGNFHYEINRPSQAAAQQQQSLEHYAEDYVKPAAQLQYQQEQQKYQQEQQQQYQQQQQQQQEHQQQQQQSQTSQPSQPLHTNIHHSQLPTNEYESTSIADDTAGHDSVTSKSVVFVTVNTPASPQREVGSSSIPPPSSVLDISHKTPHEYVAEAAAAASQTRLQHAAPPTTQKPQGGYTYVEVQKSVNIHNKLITEKDGRLVEQHETTYYPPQYGQRLPQAPKQQLQQFQLNPQQLAPAPFSPKDYVSLSANPIHVQHIDSEIEHQEEAESHAALQHAEAPPHPQYAQNSEPQYTHHQYVEKIVSQPYNVQVEKIVEHPYPITHVEGTELPERYPVKDSVGKIFDRPAPEEKYIDRPVKVPYAVQVDHYIDRPYPVHEIIETHVPVPYPVVEHVGVPMPYDRPYPVETIVEKPVPYPVEKVIEKVVEKHIPVEVERIVEKPVEKVVQRFVDRPIAIPIHVPVAFPIPIHNTHPYYASEPFPPILPDQPNALANSFSAGTSGGSNIPTKVLQNYYIRMLKKLIPQMTAFKTQPHPTPPSSISSYAAAASGPTKSTTSSELSSQTPKPTYKITDIRFDLKPPPPPLGPSWTKGARYIYNTLPHDLAVSAASAPAQQTDLYARPVSSAKEQYDEFQRWRNGHSLKRSPQFGRNLQVEYGFKPPLVPSVEIDDQGMPLNSGILNEN